MLFPNLGVTFGQTQSVSEISLVEVINSLKINSLAPEELETKQKYVLELKVPTFVAGSWVTSILFIPLLCSSSSPAWCVTGFQGNWVGWLSLITPEEERVIL